MASETSLVALKVFCRARGMTYIPGGWGATRRFRSSMPMPCHQRSVTCNHITGRRVSLVGWSLGGFSLYSAQSARWRRAQRDYAGQSRQHRGIHQPVSERGEGVVPFGFTSTGCLWWHVMQPRAKKPCASVAARMFPPARLYSLDRWRSATRGSHDRRDPALHENIRVREATSAWASMALCWRLPTAWRRRKAAGTL